MTGLKRNQKPFYYCLYKDKIPIVDTDGNETGESITIYDDPVLMFANISPATGTAQTEQFGNMENYDKVIVTCDLDCPIDENSVLFIDKEPEYTEGVTVDYQESQTLFGNPTVTPVTVQLPAYDYIVRRVARSLNSISIAVSKAEVS